MFKVICNQKDLVKAIGESQKAVSNKSTMEVLKNFYLKAFNGSLEIIGYDLEVAISSIFETTIEQEGEILINAKLFSDIIRKLPQSQIELSVEDKELTIKCNSSIFNIKCEESSAFPDLPESLDNSLIEINQEMLKKMIKETIFATSQDITKPVLMGVLIEFEDTLINFVAIDGYRLAVSTNSLSGGITNTKIIVPAKTLNDVSSLLNSTNNIVKVGFNEKHIMFISENTKIIGRLIGGEFIEYKKLLPKQYNSLVTLKTSDFLSAIERASILSSGKDNLVKFVIRDNFINIVSNADNGNALETVDISLSGDYLDIAFNSRYICEALKVIDTEEITLEFTTNINPCIIKPIYKEEVTKNYTYLILPVRVSSNS